MNCPRPSDLVSMPVLVVLSVVTGCSTSRIVEWHIPDDLQGLTRVTAALVARAGAVQFDHIPVDIGGQRIEITVSGWAVCELSAKRYGSPAKGDPANFQVYVCEGVVTGGFLQRSRWVYLYTIHQPRPVCDSRLEPAGTHVLGPAVRGGLMLCSHRMGGILAKDPEEYALRTANRIELGGDQTTISMGSDESR